MFEGDRGTAVDRVGDGCHHMTLSDGWGVVDGLVEEGRDGWDAEGRLGAISRQLSRVRGIPPPA